MRNHSTVCHQTKLLPSYLWHLCLPCANDSDCLERRETIHSLLLHYRLPFRNPGFIDNERRRKPWRHWFCPVLRDGTQHLSWKRRPWPIVHRVQNPILDHLVTYQFRRQHCPHELYHCRGKWLLPKLHDYNGCTVLQRQSRYDCWEGNDNDRELAQQTSMVPKLHSHP